MAAAVVDTVDLDAVRQSVQQGSSYFDDLLCLIPHQYYFPKAVDESRWESKYTKNKKADKTIVREAKKQKKLQKLDPDPSNYQSIPQILLQRIGQEEPLKPLHRPGAVRDDDDDGVARANGKAAAEDDDDSSNDEEIDSDHEEINGGSDDEDEAGSDDEDDSDSESSPKKQTRNKGQNKDAMDVDNADDDEMAPFMPSDDREAARKKLLEKINELRRKRKAPELDENFKAAAASVPNAKRRKTKETDSGKDGKPKPPKNNKNPKGASANKGEGDSSAMDVDNNNGSQQQQNSKKKSAGDDVDDAAIQFGTFDFSTGKPLPTYLAQQRKRPSNQELLKKAEAEKKKLEAMAGTAEAEQIKEAKAWDAVMKRAAGEKVKDRVDLLKKSVKREQSKKKKSAEKWKEREEAVKKAQEDRQKKRAENIQSAMQKRKDKRMGIKPKKTGGRPGFEGKRLNK